MLTAQTAWILVENGGSQTASSFDATAIKTVDGGHSWTLLGHASAGGMAVAIQFVDQVHGWIYGTASAGGALGSGDSTLLDSMDGGVTWSVAAVSHQDASSGQNTLPVPCQAGGPPSAPIFSSPKVGWLSGPICANEVFLFSSPDSGQSWRRVTLPAFPGPPSGYAPNDPPFPDSVHFASPSSGNLVVHRGFTTGANALQDAALYSTSNGGASWVAATPGG